MFKASDITVYIPCFNAASTIDLCLQGLASQSSAPAKIILVDDGSNPPLAPDIQISAKIRSLGVELELLRQPRNMGLSAARNLALANTDTTLVASLDSDVVPAHQWLEKLLDAMNTRDVVGVGGRLDEFYSDSLGDRWRAVHMAQHWGPSPLRNPRFLFGSNNLFITSVLNCAGGYNPSLRTNYEDMSLSQLLYNNGFDLFYEPAAKASHMRRDSEFSILRGYWQWHHSKGLLAGDFNSPKGVISRIGCVNFGIFRHRFNMDNDAGRVELLNLDILLPVVFCALDLRKFHDTTGGPVPVFPLDFFLGQLPEWPATTLLKILEPLGLDSIQSPSTPWSGDYLKELQAQASAHKRPV